MMDYFIITVLSMVSGFIIGLLYQSAALHLHLQRQARYKVPYSYGDQILYVLDEHDYNEMKDALLRDKYRSIHQAFSERSVHSPIHPTTRF